MDTHLISYTQDMEWCLNQVAPKYVVTKVGSDVLLTRKIAHCSLEHGLLFVPLFLKLVTVDFSP